MYSLCIRKTRMEINFDLKYGEKCHAFASTLMQTIKNYGDIISIDIPVIPLPPQVSQFDYKNGHPEQNDEFLLKVIHPEDARQVNAWLIRIMGIQETHAFSLIGRLMLGSVWEIYDEHSTSRMFAQDLEGDAWRAKGHDVVTHRFTEMLGQPDGLTAARQDEAAFIFCHQHGVDVYW